MLSVTTRMPNTLLGRERHESVIERINNRQCLYTGVGHYIMIQFIRVGRWNHTRCRLCRKRDDNKMPVIWYVKKINELNEGIQEKAGSSEPPMIELWLVRCWVGLDPGRQLKSWASPRMIATPHSGTSREGARDLRRFIQVKQKTSCSKYPVDSFSFIRHVVFCCLCCLMFHNMLKVETNYLKVELQICKMTFYRICL